MSSLIDLFLNLDQHLVALAGAYGPWIYLVLFLIVFAETGLVVTPILPGDSLLFAAGAVAATGALNVWMVLGRFVPIVRTFVPFVAGAGDMTYSTFAFYNVAGALLWVGTCVGAGYGLGNVPIVKENFSLVALGIVFVSVLPAVFEILKSKRAPQPPASSL